MRAPVLFVVLALVAFSLLLLAGGLALRRRGHLATQPLALVWALLTVAPLFGGGALFYLNHVRERAVGITQPGRDTPPNRFAP